MQGVRQVRRVLSKAYCDTAASRRSTNLSVTLVAETRKEQPKYPSPVPMQNAGKAFEVQDGFKRKAIMDILILQEVRALLRSITMGVV